MKIALFIILLPLALRLPTWFLLELAFVGFVAYLWRVYREENE